MGENTVGQTRQESAPDPFLNSTSSGTALPQPHFSEFRGQLKQLRNFHLMPDIPSVCGWVFNLLLLWAIISGSRQIISYVKVNNVSPMQQVSQELSLVAQSIHQALASLFARHENTLPAVPSPVSPAQQTLPASQPEPQKVDQSGFVRF